jgi:hypothetical protein
MKTKKTNRKFYNKWLYKVSLRIPGAYMFRIYTLESIDKMLSGELESRYDHHKSILNEKSLIEGLVSIFKIQDPKSWTKRIENSILDIYTNDYQFYSLISSQFQNRVIHRYEPSESSIKDLDQNDIVLVKKYPHNRYQYKVYLKPHKLANQIEDKTRYVSWLKSQTPRITCTPAIESWFVKTNWNWDRRYILVEDENTLLLLKLRNSEVIGKIYNYVISDK